MTVHPWGYGSLSSLGDFKNLRMYSTSSKSQLLSSKLRIKISHVATCFRKDLGLVIELRTLIDAEGTDTESFSFKVPKNLFGVSPVWMAMWSFLSSSKSEWPIRLLIEFMKILWPLLEAFPRIEEASSLDPSMIYTCSYPAAPVTLLMLDIS